MKIVIPVLCSLLICGIGLAIGLLNRAEPVKDSLADAQNEFMTSLEENVASTKMPEPTPETVNDINKEKPEIDTSLTASSVLSSGLSLREAWGIYNEFKKSHAETGATPEEIDEFLSNLLFDLGTTLAQLEYCDNAGMFNEQQQVAQVSNPSKPTQQPSKTSEPGTLPDGVLKRSTGHYSENSESFMHEWLYTKAGITTNIYKMDSKGEYTVLVKTEFSLYALYDSYKDIPDDSKDSFVAFTDGTWKRKDVDVYEFYEDIPKELRYKYMQDNTDGYWHVDWRAEQSDAIKRFYDAYGD